MPFIEIRGVSKAFQQENDSYCQKLQVLKDFSLQIESQEFVTFFGPNACGKTTLLNLVAGLDGNDSGIIEIAGKAPIETKVGYVFQNFHLSSLPWKRNVDNIAFPLELQGIRKEERRRRVECFLANLEIDLPLHGYPYQLSGGQQQLLAISRALISEPQVLLLDEPLNQLDYQTRISMLDQLLRIWQKTRTTILYVSHDLDDALILGDRIVFLSKRPAQIREVIINTLPRPRDHTVVETQDFFSLKQRGIRIFEEALK